MAQNKNYYRKSLYTLLLFVFIILPNKGCELSSIVVVNCHTCFADYPSYYNVLSNISINKENQNVPIKVYYGKIEDNALVYEMVSHSKNTYLWLETEAEHTLVAEYKKEGRTHLVVNSVKMRVLKDYESCSEPCYYVIGDKIDLKLK
jgi:hypothetical protein